MPHDDDGSTPGKYDADFPAIVRTFLKPPVSGWGPTYSEAAAIEQALRRAYWQGRMDGVDAVLGPAPAPSVPVDEIPVEEPPESREAAWERLGLFPVPGAAPKPLSAVLGTLALDPLEGDPYAWAVRQVRKVTGASLIEADEWMTEVLA